MNSHLQKGGGKTMDGKKRVMWMIYPGKERLGIVQIGSQGGGLELQNQGIFAWHADWSEMDGEQELRKLQQHFKRLRKKRAGLVIPSSWGLFYRTIVPDLSEADLGAFLQLQAEKKFGITGADFQVLASRARSAKNEVTVCLVKKKLVAQIQVYLEKAGFQIEQWIPEAALHTQDGCQLVFTEFGAELIQAVDQSVKQVKSFTWQGDLAGQSGLWSQLSREIKMIRPEFLRLVGHSNVLEQAQRILKVQCPDLALELAIPEINVACESADWSCIQPAYSGAILALKQSKSLFIHPQMNEQTKSLPWKQWLLHRHAKGVAYSLLFIFGLFIWIVVDRVVTLSELRENYGQLKPQAEEVDQTRERLDFLNHWFGQKCVTLDTIQVISAAFPEVGEVWTESLSIQAEKVFVSGKATSESAWLQMQEKLRETAGVRDLKVQHLRQVNGDKAKLEFGLRFTFQGVSR